MVIIIFLISYKVPFDTKNSRISCLLKCTSVNKNAILLSKCHFTKNTLFDDLFEEMYD